MPPKDLKMSIKVMSWYWDNSELEGNDLLLILALADWCNDEGFCYYGMKRIAKRIRRTERTAQTIIADLEKRNEIVVESGAGTKTINGPTNRYYLAAYCIKNGMPLPGNDNGRQKIKEVGSIGGAISAQDRKNQRVGVKESSPVGVKESSPVGVKESSPKPSELTISINQYSSSSAPPSEPFEKKEDQQTPFTLFEQNGFGFPSIIITDMINDMINEYGSPWVCEAMLEAVKQNKRNLKYTEGILRRWKASGKGEYVQNNFLGDDSDPAIQLLISRQKEEKISAQLRLNLDQRKAITEAKITDMEKWKQVISAGRQRGYKLTNVEWMIDMYQKDLSNVKQPTNHLDRRSQAKAAMESEWERQYREIYGDNGAGATSL
jgi:DnaD/phage-associated family protein